MRRATFWQQLKALLKRNFLLKRRNKQQTLQEFLLPIYFILILALIRFLTTPESSPAITDTHPYNLDQFHLNKSKVLYVTPNTTSVRYAATRLSRVLQLTTDPEFFDEPLEAEESYSLNFSNVLIGIDFHNEPLMNYTLRVPSELIVSTSLHYAGLGQCRQMAGLQDSILGCKANTYIYSAFVNVQVALDTILLQVAAKPGFTILAPEVWVQLLPKPAYLPDTLTFQILSSIYFVLAYSVFISFLTVNLVSEKEKKIKEAMRLMSMRDSAFWLSWGIVYSIIILIVTTAVTLLAWACSFFQNSNIFIFFLMMMLYGLSIINLSFTITPFFNRADTGGAMSSLATIFMSLLYLIIIFTRGPTGEPTLPVWSIYLLCLLSPFALSLAIDRAVILDIAYGGMNFTTINIGVFPLSQMLIMLAVDVVLYGFLAFYFDNVIPNEYGLARPPWFFLVPSYWRPRKARYLEEVSLVEHGETGMNEQPTVTIDTDHMEAVPPEFRNKNMLRIFDMHKVYKTKDKDIHAVNGISLDIYEGQITALLGHNGAGKTTLMHMLTGMSPATSGSATIYGLDVGDTNDLNEARTMIGLCPQHNILFDELTPREHLEFYASIKGVQESSLNSEVSDSLHMVDLSDQADTMSKSLSGGQKRKLCVGIALIGDPKVIFLDEPTAGMDPSSRRHLWRLLKQKQQDKLIVLTTHFMDEADILADRKAIISKGRLQCVGSSLFLKNRFGIGYHLSMVLEPSAKVDDISQLVKGHVNQAEAQRHHGKELAYTLPISAVSQFPCLFAALEKQVHCDEDLSSTLGIRSYGVSMTTLEEVFLKLGEEAEGDDDSDPTADRARTMQTPLNLNRTGYSNYGYANANFNQSQLDVTGQPHSPNHFEGYGELSEKQLARQRIRALLKIRLLLLFRNIPKFIFQVIFPIIYMFGGAAMKRFIPVPSPRDQKALIMNPFLYAKTPAMTHNPPLVYNISAPPGQEVDEFNDTLHNQGLTQLMAFTDVPSLLDSAPHYIGLQVDNINKSVAQVIESTMTVLYNDSAVHSLPATINLLMSTLGEMVTASDHPGGIATYSKPWPWLTGKTFGFNGAVFGSSMFLGIALMSIPGGFGTNVVKDRTSYVKSQLRLAGVSMNMYWGTVFAFDAMQFTIACLIMLIIVLAFQIAAMSTTGAVLSILFCYVGYIPSNMLTSYNLSYLYSSIETAQSSLPSLFVWSSLLPFLAMSIIDMTGNEPVALALHYTFSVLFPTYPMIGAFYFIDKVHQRAIVLQATAHPSVPVSTYFAPDSHILITLLMPIVHVVLLYLLLRLNEVRSTGGPWTACLQSADSNKAFPGASIRENNDFPVDEDTDVAAERARVEESERNIQTPPQHVIRVKNLRKEFNRDQKDGKCCQWKSKTEGIRVAVRNTSFLVEPGEVLGLLGPNGAGKTTTLNMIIAETAPTCGKIDVAGHDIRSNLSAAFQAMGYCPQHDALWEHIHLREHLECYAAVRGIPSGKVSEVINFYMESLDIKEHANKRAKALSGGTKRKLSYIMGMLGDPKVVLMDEPSTGMDPKSKRFLWDTISAAFTNASRGAILTTHYMDEADALCSRVAIMINGHIECLGSTQHLKNKYGGGYHLEVKLRGAMNSERAEQNMEDLNRYVMEAFPGTVVQEAFGDRAQYRVPHTSVNSLADTFKKLEEAKVELAVEEYSFSQATLEQVFLEFAKNQKEECEPEEHSTVHNTGAVRTRSIHRQMSMQVGEIHV